MLRIAPLLLAASIAGAPLTAGAATVDAGERISTSAAAEVSITLRGSRASMLRQNRIAKEEAYSFLRTTKQVRSYVENGYLVPLDGNEDYRVLAGHPFARPVVRAFVERLSAGYREACGEQLVVTSLTRPSARQPRNASPLSVHPAGMAVDLRVSQVAGCREWLSGELLDLESRGLIDGTLERYPPHYHVAVFPAEFGAYDAQLAAMEAEAERQQLEAAAREADLAMALLRIKPAIAPVRPVRMLHMIASVVALLFLPVTV